jgi:hypothetical protein
MNVHSQRIAQSAQRQHEPGRRPFASLMQVAFAGTWNDVVEHRPAFFTALVGSALACGLLTLVPYALADQLKDERTTEVEFYPGFIARLGVEDAIGTDTGTGTVAPDAPTQSTADAPQPDPAPATTPNTVSDTPSTSPRPKRPRGSTAPHGLPQPSTNPGKLPSIGKGDPFASPDGWSDMDRGGDAWATNVMQALAQMEVGAFGRDLEGQYKFQLTICSDGSIDRITNRGGDISASGRAAIRLALEQLDLPRPPASVRSMMDRRCAQIAHVFVWSAASVK